jgi:hypothetical protein
VLVLALAGGCALTSAGAAATVRGVEAGATTAWSPPAVLDACAAEGAPGIVFPSDKPTQATGPGAIVWSASRRCRGGSGARVAAMGLGDIPGPSLVPRRGDGAAIDPRGPLTVSPAPHGNIVIAGSAAGGGGGGGLLIEGAAGGPFSPLATAEATAAPLALSTAYQGDLALASGSRSGRLSVHVQRHFAASFDRSGVASAGDDSGTPHAGDDHSHGHGEGHGHGGEKPRALSVALDFRSDALAVWSAGDALYARDLPALGASHAIQRLATVGAHTTIAALLSDDNRGIVAWADQGRDHTSVYLDQSATGVRFGTPRLLESFRDPDGLTSPAGSPRLVRLSSESVMLAWAGVSSSHWVVRTAAIDQRGLQRVSTIATAGTDELLADLAPGPLGEALLLWSEPQPDLSHQAIFSARGTEAAPGRTFFAEPEALAPVGANADPLVAFDPASDRAVAVWRGAGGRIEYAIRRSSAGS